MAGHYSSLNAKGMIPNFKCFNMEKNWQFLGAIKRPRLDSSSPSMSCHFCYMPLIIRNWGHFYSNVIGVREGGHGRNPMEWASNRPTFQIRNKIECTDGQDRWGARATALSPPIQVFQSLTVFIISIKSNLKIFFLPSLPTLPFPLLVLAAPGASSLLLLVDNCWTFSRGN